MGAVQAGAGTKEAVVRVLAGTDELGLVLGALDAVLPAVVLATAVAVARLQDTATRVATGALRSLGRARNTLLLALVLRTGLPGTRLIDAVSGLFTAARGHRRRALANVLGVDAQLDQLLLSNRHREALARGQAGRRADTATGGTASGIDGLLQSIEWLAIAGYLRAGRLTDGTGTSVAVSRKDNATLSFTAVTLGLEGITLDAGGEALSMLTFIA